MIQFHEMFSYMLDILKNNKQNKNVKIYPLDHGLANASPIVASIPPLRLCAQFMLHPT